MCFATLLSKSQRDGCAEAGAEILPRRPLIEILYRGGLWPDRMLGTPFTKGKFLLCLVASRLLPLSKRESTLSRFHPSHFQPNSDASML